MDTTQLSPKRSLSLRMMAGIIAIVALAAIARYGYMQYTGTRQESDSVSVLEARLQNLENTILLQEKRIAKLEEDAQKPAAMNVKPHPSLTPLTQDQEKRISALEKQISTQQPIQPLQDREEIYQSIRLLSSLHHFSDKALSGKPFTAELASFEQQVGNNEDTLKLLSTLSPYAESGIPTFAQLLASFDDSVAQMNNAESTPPPEAGLWGRFIYMLTHIISVRKIDDNQTGNSIDAIIARAQAHLEREEIEATIAEIKSLPENARSNFTSWMDDAEMATEAPTLIEQIEDQMMQKAFHAEMPPSSTPTAKGHS